MVWFVGTDGFDLSGSNLFRPGILHWNRTQDSWLAVQYDDDDDDGCRPQAIATVQLKKEKKKNEQANWLSHRNARAKIFPPPCFLISFACLAISFIQ